MSPQAWPPVPSDSGWITPTLASGWATPAGNHAPLRYRLIDGEVQMQGAATGSTTADPLFTFPVGFRPDIATGKELYFAVMSGTSGTPPAMGRIVIRANGTVNAVGGQIPNFDVIRFRAI